MIEQETITEDIESPQPKRQSFIGDVLKLVSGTTISQILLILIAPILTRLYAPDAFGIAALFTSIVTVIGGISCLRYELTIMLPHRDEEAANLLGVSLVAVVLITFLTIPVILFGGNTIVSLLNAPALGPYLWLIPAAILINGFFLALNYWNSRTRHFGRLSVSRVTNSLVTAASQLGSGFLRYESSGGLIVGTILGSFVSTAILSAQVWLDDFAFFRKSLRWEVFTHNIIRYRRFPLYEIWSQLLNTISWQLPAFLLTAYFSPSVAGYYSIGYRVLSLPMSLIGAALGQVFFQRAAQAKKENNLATLVQYVFQALVIFSMAPLFFLSIIGKDLFTIVFGSQWSEAGVYTQILSVWTFLWFISSPLSSIYGVLEKHKQSLGLQILIFSTRLLSLWLGSYYGNARLAIALFSISGVLVYGYLIISILIMSEVSWNTVFKILYSAIKYMIPALGLLLVLQFYLANNFSLVIASGIILVAYYWITIRTEPSIRESLMGIELFQRLLRFLPLGK